MSKPYIRVVNFEKFQHYKDRSPPWIKLYNEILDDYEFSCLQDASKLHLVLIWLIASRTNNKIPADPEWISKKISATEEVNLDVLVQAGFLEKIEEKQLVRTPKQAASKVLATCKQNACLEREGEREREKEKDIGVKYTEEFLNAWIEYPKRSGSNDKRKAFRAWRTRLDEGHTADVMIHGMKRYAVYCKTTHKIGTEFVMQAGTFFGPADPPHFKNEWQSPAQKQKAPHSDQECADYGAEHNSPAKPGEIMWEFKNRMKSLWELNNDG